MTKKIKLSDAAKDVNVDVQELISFFAERGAQALHVVAVAFMRLHDSGALRDDSHGFRRERMGG